MFWPYGMYSSLLYVQAHDRSSLMFNAKMLLPKLQTFHLSITVNCENALFMVRFEWNNYRKQVMMQVKRMWSQHVCLPKMFSNGQALSAIINATLILLSLVPGCCLRQETRKKKPKRWQWSRPWSDKKRRMLKREHRLCCREKYTFKD